MRHLLLVLLGILLISFLFVYAALASPLSQSSTPAPRPQSVISYAGEIIEWRDNRDGTSNILMECMPQRQQIWSEALDNKLLRKLDLDKVLERLDKECQKAMAGYG